MCGQNCQMRRIWSYFWHQTVFPCSFPGTSVLFLYRNVKETVVSFQRVMAAFTTLARFFTNDQVIFFLKRQERWQLTLQEMNQWWVDDLPLPLPHTTYRWARDQDMLVRNPTRDEEGWKLNRIHTGPAEHACSNGPQLLLHSRLCTRLHQAGPQHLLPGLQVFHIIFICYNCLCLFQGPSGTPWRGLVQSRILLRSGSNQREALGGPQKVSFRKCLW